MSRQIRVMRSSGSLDMRVLTCRFGRRLTAMHEGRRRGPETRPEADYRVLTRHAAHDFHICENSS